MMLNNHDDPIKAEPSTTTKNTPRALHYSAPQLIRLETKNEIQGGAQQLEEGNDGALS